MSDFGPFYLWNILFNNDRLAYWLMVYILINDKKLNQSKYEKLKNMVYNYSVFEGIGKIELIILILNVVQN